MRREQAVKLLHEVFSKDPAIEERHCKYVYLADKAGGQVEEDFEIRLKIEIDGFSKSFAKAIAASYGLTLDDMEDFGLIVIR
jgi:hypothetical protein